MKSRKRKMLQDRGALPKEEGNVVGEYRAGLSDCDPVAWTGVRVVTDVRVSPSSAVAECSEDVSSDSD